MSIDRLVFDVTHGEQLEKLLEQHLALPFYGCFACRNNYRHQFKIVEENTAENTPDNLPVVAAASLGKFECQQTRISLGLPPALLVCPDMIALVHIDRPVPFINMTAQQIPDCIGIQNGKIAADHLAESAKGGAYEAQAKKTAEGMRKQYSGSMMSDPKIVARAISRAANTRRPKARYLIGFGAKPLVFLHTLLPARWFDWFMMHAS